MSGFSFNDLNLSGVDVQEGRGLLAPGRYVAEVKAAKLKKTSNGQGTILEVVLADTHGAGAITWNLNVHNPSAEATRIGRSELKSLLHWGGHPNPDKPEDISKIKGLVVGLNVKPDTYMKNGVAQPSAKVSSVFDPADLEPTKYTPRPAPTAAKKADNLNDDIPF